MDRKKIFCCLALTILLSVILLPLQEADSFRGNFDRDRFILNPPGGGQISLSRILNRQTLHTADPVEKPDPGPAPDPEATPR